MISSADLAAKWQDLCRSYDHLTLHVLPGPRSASYFFSIFLFPAALLIPPSILSHRQLSLIFLPLILACEIHSWEASGVLDVISWTILQWSLVLLVVYDPRRDFTRVWWEAVPLLQGDGHLSKEHEAPEYVLVEKEQAYPEHLVERIPWVLTLLISIRLTGWKTGDPAHDKTQPHERDMSRATYLRQALGTLMICYILMDVSTCYVRTDPYFTTAFMGIDAPFPVVAPPPGFPGIVLSSLHRLPPRAVRSGIMAAQVYGMVAGMFYPGAVPAIGLNAVGLLPDEWSPHTWPAIFGSFPAVLAHGLRGLWGLWWHQMNRQIVATPGRGLAEAWGLERGSVLKYMIVTASAFGFSGLSHMGLVPPRPLSTLVTPHEMRMYVGGFFWSQIIGFGLEFAVTRAFNRIAPSVKDWPVTKLATLAWVFGWLCLCLPLLTVPFRELGYWTVWPVPISIVKGFSGEGWLMWQ